MAVVQIPANQVNSIYYNDQGWTTTRTAPAGTIQPPPSTKDAWIYQASGRSGIIYNIARIFAIFDTSAYAGTITAVDLYFYSLGSPNIFMDVIAVESGAYGGSPTGPITIGDYSFINWAQTYTAQTPIPTAGTGMVLAGNANLVALANSGVANIAIINGSYDQQDIDPGGSPWTEIYLDIDEQNLPTTFLEVTYTPSGYGNDVNGVASADISSINGVATADIFEVNGV
jgi:hypothetical protein